MSRARLLLTAFLVSIPHQSLLAESKSTPTLALASSSYHTSPDVFGSVALALGKTRFDSRWRRVFSSTDSKRVPVFLKAADHPSSLDQLRFVNAAINRRIRYRFDTHPSGDHWANASETFATSAGDCEDIVIAKMQALRSMGIPAKALYMTIGNDTASGAVHALLLARVGSRFWVLDNRTDRLVPHNEYGDFHPMLTFSATSAWLHGYRLGETPAAVQQLGLALNTSRALKLGNSQAYISARPNVGTQR